MYGGSGGDWEAVFKGAAVGGAGDRGVVAPLAVRVTDRVDRGQVENVEAHLPDIREAGLDIAECGVLRGSAGCPAPPARPRPRPRSRRPHRAREHLVPG